MEAKDVKRNMNKVVSVSSNSVKGKYKFTAYTLRRDEKTGVFFQQAELQDLKARSVIICRLEDVKEIVQND